MSKLIFLFIITCLASGAWNTTRSISLLPGCGTSNNRYACKGGITSSPTSTRKVMMTYIWDALKNPINGANLEECALVMAMAMQETYNMDTADTSKGDDRPESNFSPWNMNADFLSRVGCDMRCAQALGQGPYTATQIGNAVYFLLKSLRGGTAVGNACAVLNFHRGGYSGWRDCRDCWCDCQYDCKAFRDAQADAASLLLASQGYMSPHTGSSSFGTRVCMDVPHV